MSNLYDFIHALTPSEKRYFQRMATFQADDKENQYVHLFNLISKQKTYDEVALKKVFGDRFFPQLKQHLYKKVLFSLRLYNASTIEENDPGKYIVNADLLLKKGLINLAKKEQLKAERQTQSDPYSADALKVYKSFVLSGSGTDTADSISDRLERHKEYTLNYLDNLKEEFEMERIFLKVESLNKQFEGARSEEEESTIHSFLNDPFLANDYRVKSPYAGILRTFSLGLASYLSGEFIACEKWMEACLEIFDDQPELRKKHQKIVLRALANSCLMKIYRKSQDFQNVFKALKEFACNSPNDSEYRQYLVYVLELMYLNSREDFRKAFELIENSKELTEVIEALSEEKGEVSQEKVYAIFQRVRTYLGMQQLKQAEMLLRAFIRKKAFAIKEDAYILARVLLLLLYFRTKDELLIETELRSLKRYLQSREKLYDFEKKTLNFVDRLLNEQAPKEKEKLLGNFRSEIDQLSQNKRERNAFLYFNFQDWVREESILQ